MKQGRIEIRHNFAGETGFVILKAYKTSNLSVAIPEMTEVYPAPHSETTYLKTELDPVMYVVKAYRSADGVSEDQEINSLACDASISAVHILETFYYMVGRGQSESDDDGIIWTDPVEGEKQIIDKRLDGKKFTVEERATGKLLPQSEIGAEWETIPGGGFKFTDPEKQFWDGGVYAVTVEYRSNIVTTDEAAAAGVKIITEDTNFISDDYGKTIFAQGPNVAVIKYNIPSFNSIPDGELKFSNNISGQRYIVVQLASGNNVQLRGKSLNRICLGYGDTMTLIKVGAAAYITQEPISYGRLGVQEFAYSIGETQYQLDGSEHNLADFPRVEDYINSLPGSLVTSFATWNLAETIAPQFNDGVERIVYKHKGLWAVNGDRFKFPDLRGQTVRGFNAGSGWVPNNIGGFQYGRTARHLHSFEDYYYIDDAGTLSPASNKRTMPVNYNANRGSGNTDSNNNTALFFLHNSELAGSSLDPGGSVDNIGLIAVINI